MINFFTKRVISNLSLTLLFILISLPALSADQTIEMLNKLGKENMVYSKKIVNIDVGDTVFWKSTKPGHNVEFIKGGSPEGVGKFRSAISKDTEYTFEIPGIYAYWCTPHKGMGMIGFVVVGNNTSNLEAIKKIKYMGKSKTIALELINSL
jgi:pseudoazurin